MFVRPGTGFGGADASLLGAQTLGLGKLGGRYCFFTTVMSLTYIFIPSGVGISTRTPSFQ